MTRNENETRTANIDFSKKREIELYSLFCFTLIFQIRLSTFPKNQQFTVMLHLVCKKCTMVLYYTNYDGSTLIAANKFSNNE